MACIRKITLPLFIKTVKRAMKYRITDIQTLERIAILQLNEGNYEAPFVETNEAFKTGHPTLKVVLPMRWICPDMTK